MDEPKDVFKDSARGRDRFEEKVADLRKEIDDRNARLKAMADKLNDPVYLSGMMLSVQSERENTNRILKNIYAELERVRELSGRLERIEAALAGGGSAPAPAMPRGEHMLSEIDEQLVRLAKKRGRICAGDAQRAFGYRGRNAASARLNRMYEMGVLDKAQAGRTVYYFARK
ncbi:MAG: hypothetical protein PHF51_02570 [Candidatus ainarchaeum sp.]|nr:hypothetical protein [Candidatus ainarchaeum sp.]